MVICVKSAPTSSGVYLPFFVMAAYPAIKGDMLTLSTSTLMMDGLPLRSSKGGASSGSALQSSLDEGRQWRSDRAAAGTNDGCACL